MSVDGKGPVSGPSLRWYTHLLPGKKGGEAPLTGASVRARSEITTLKPPAGRRWLLRGCDNIFPLTVKLIAHRPVAARIEIKDLQMPVLLPAGYRMGIPARELAAIAPQHLVFEDVGSLRMGPFERTADLAAPRRRGLLQTRAPRLLAMVMKVLKFDVSAWLSGNRK